MSISQRHPQKTHPLQRKQISFLRPNERKRTPTKPKKSHFLFKSEITFLRQELKKKDYVVRILFNMACKSIDDCTSASCNNLPSAKSPIENRIEISDTLVENTPKESNITKKCRSWVLS